ncbi:MAG: hypothetical protein RQ735_02220 [Flavobacteriaceae bacterium]|nr:hypothetical protein [Flavobacteriaceae bacterium]
MQNAHTFHIPVMGIGFTLDTPLKVSPYGIDSVISLVDDILLEKMRKMYCEKYKRHYREISSKVEDFRAKRITAYLNLIHDLAKEKFENLKNSATKIDKDLKAYFNLLPDSAVIKQEFNRLTDKYFHAEDIKKWLHDNLYMGSIDVNIMTKIDKDNYQNNEKLPQEFNDAHAALRGFGKSNLNASVVFSAGMNPRLYTYLEQFDDFYPNADGHFKKKIILKVSDYRSAFIQGKFFAKKGLWVSEYRIESGLNCGGHAFATDGFLLGPILAEFRDNRTDFIQTLHDTYTQALSGKEKTIPAMPPGIKITAQGGVGTAEEHRFLKEHYQLDSVGWGTPFLLVPEATTVDKTTLEQLVRASEKDLYLSNISPLGVPFNNIRNNTKDAEKRALIEKGRPGSSCPKKYVALNKEFTDKAICTASRQYQNLKIKELNELQLNETEYQKNLDRITEKSCICVGLGTASLLAHGLDTKTEGIGVSVCPGPNLAYFSKVMTLKEIADHIYGIKNQMTHPNRPHVFVKELNIYIDYLKAKFEETRSSMTEKQQSYLLTFAANLQKGKDYYVQLFSQLKNSFQDSQSKILKDLSESEKMLASLYSDIQESRLILVTSR